MDGLSGSLRTMPMRDLLLSLARQRASGRLLCYLDGHCIKLQLRDGTVELVATSQAEHYLSAALRRAGVAAEALRRALCGAPGMQLGEVLLRQGGCPPDLLKTVLAAHSRGTVQRLLASQGGTFRYFAGAPPRREGPPAASLHVDLLALCGEVTAAPQAPAPGPGEDFAALFRHETTSRLRERGRGKRFPVDLQRRAVAYYRSRVLQGSCLAAVARALGLPAPTLRRWVIDAPAGLPLPSTTAAEALPVLVGPGGLRVEGLTVSAMAELLQRLEVTADDLAAARPQQLVPDTSVHSCDVL